jgi:hypothetical protein
MKKAGPRPTSSPSGGACCQRSDNDNHPGCPRCRDEKISMDLAVLSHISWTCWGVQSRSCYRVLLREERPKFSLMSPSDRADLVLVLPPMDKRVKRP